MGPKLYLPLALLFLASADPSRAQSASAEVVAVEGAPLTVECPLRVEQRAQWRLEGAAPPADMAPAPESAPGGRLRARLHAARARPAHAGLYSCGPDAAQRVRVTVLPSPSPAPTPGEAQPPSTTAPAAGAEPPSTLPPKLQYFDVGRPFALNCTTSVAGGYQWRVNGTAIEEVAALKDRYALEEGGAVLRVGVHARTHEDDFGEYVCGIAGVTEAAAVFDVRGRPVVKLQPNSNVVEGQKLRLVCKLVGKPYPAVEWRRRNGSADLDDGDVPPGVPVAAVMGARAHLNASEQGVSGAELVVDPAERSDAGVYQCAPLSEEGVAAETTLRVKDKYAALWPFLGICAEVFVLCAIILIYERRRSKPELDDSDTDNHDQKKS